MANIRFIVCLLVLMIVVSSAYRRALSRSDSNLYEKRYSAYFNFNYGEYHLLYHLDSLVVPNGINHARASFLNHVVLVSNVIQLQGIV